MVKMLLSPQSYQARDKAVTASRLVNMYAEMNPEGSKYPFTLYPHSGYVSWCNTASVKPIQGMQVMGSLLYVVTGNEVFKIDTAGAKTSLGTITGTEARVDMANDGTNMTLVTSDGDGFVVTSSSVTQITDGDFPTASSVTFLDNYTIVSKASSGQFYISSSLDPTAWDALDFATAEEHPDNLVKVESFNSALWLFGETSYEVYYNSGNADFPFEQIAGASNTTRGCAAKFSVVKDDNSMFFLGNDRIFYRVVGYSTQRISTHALESDMTDYTSVSDAFAFIYNQDGHKFMVVTFPTDGKTWSYDLATGLWAERTTLVGYTPQMWSGNAHASFAGKELIGHNADGVIYELSKTTYTEAGTTIENIIQGSVSWMEGARIIYDRVRLDVDAGRGLTTGQGSDPQVMMRWSDDGTESWSNENWRSFGKRGEFTVRPTWRRLGQARERVFEFKITDPVPFKVTGAYADVRLGKA